MDRLDREIISFLQYDGRMPYTQIADELGISEGTVRQRVKRLTDSGILQIVAIVEPQHLGWNASAMVGVTIQAGRVDEVAHQIAQFQEVSYLFMASGEFDVFVEIFCKDQTHLVAFLNEHLQKIPGVIHTQTFMIMKMYKLSYQWGHADSPLKRYRLRTNHEDS